MFWLPPAGPQSVQFTGNYQSIQGIQSIGQSPKLGESGERVGPAQETWAIYDVLLVARRSAVRPIHPALMPVQYAKIIIPEWVFL
jgi:hypothetical protein